MWTLRKRFFFTFRVSAKTGAGLRLSPQFRQEVPRLNEERVVLALRQNFLSAGSQVQLAARSRRDYRKFYRNSQNNSGLEGVDYDNLLVPMGDPGLSRFLWQLPPNEYIQVWPGAEFQEELRVHGSLDFTASEELARGLRKFLNQEGALTLTFSEIPGTFPKGPFDPSAMGLQDSSTPFREAYGMGIQVSFKQPRALGSPGLDMPQRVLSQVREIPMDPRGSDPKPWSCPAHLQFKIVHPNHAQFTESVNGTDTTKTRCAKEEDPKVLSEGLRIIRTSLPSSEWYVDMVRQCVVPKDGVWVEGSCYGINSNTDQTREVRYEKFSTGCGPEENKPGLCPHYVSFCERSN